MLIDLDAAIVRTYKDSEWDELLERCYVRRIEPGCKLVHPIAFQLHGDGMYQTRSITGLYCYLSMSNYIGSGTTRHSRLEKRVRIAADAAQRHIQERGANVTVAVNEQAVLTNHDGRKCDVAYDCTNERTLLASLVNNGDLKLWERSDSRVLRGSRAAVQATRPNCYKCHFMRQNGRDYWCAATLQFPKPQKCTDFAPLLNRPLGERYVPVRSHDIWIPPWAEVPKGVFAVPDAK